MHPGLPVLGQVLLFPSLALTVFGARHLSSFADPSLGRKVDGKLYSFEFEIFLSVPDGKRLPIPGDAMVLSIQGGCYPMRNVKHRVEM